MSQALSALGFPDDLRDANLWYQLEGPAADRVAAAIETLRRRPDAALEWAFQSIDAAGEPQARAKWLAGSTAEAEPARDPKAGCRSCPGIECGQL